MTANAPATRRLPLVLAIALRELRAGGNGFAVFVACIALGVAVITGVGALGDAIRTSFERQGAALKQTLVGADGLWGPVTVAPTDALEFEIVAAGYPTTHIYRSPFPRSSDIVHLRPQPFGKDDAAATSVLYMARPRGYFFIGRDMISLDGVAPSDILAGVPTTATTRLVTSVGRSVRGVFNGEAIVARTWPAAEKQVSVIEIMQ